MVSRANARGGKEKEFFVERRGLSRSRRALHVKEKKKGEKEFRFPKKKGGSGKTFRREEEVGAKGKKKRGLPQVEGGGGSLLFMTEQEGSTHKEREKIRINSKTMQS